MEIYVIVTCILIFAFCKAIDYYSYKKIELQKKRCANGNHNMSAWRWVETTHYGDKDIYQRKCYACRHKETIINRLHPNAKKTTK